MVDNSFVGVGVRGWNVRRCFSESEREFFGRGFLGVEGRDYFKGGGSIW